MDEESYIVFPWMNGGAFGSLAELELAYGDNCVDGAIADTAELWATRSGVTPPCVGDWTPTRFSLDAEIDEWAKDSSRRPDDDGLYITGFRAWVEHKLSQSPEFDDFVWDRFTEFSFESMMSLKRNIKIACDDDIKLSDTLIYKFRERIGVQPYYVKISIPPMPNDTEERLMRAVEKARKPKKQTMRFRIPKSALSSSKHAEDGLASAIAQSKSSQKHRDKDRHVTNANGTALTGADGEQEVAVTVEDKAGEQHE